MLDQSQTITVNSVPRAYPLVQFDGFKTERVTSLADGRASTLRIDHTKGKDSQSNDRHLLQLATEVNGTDSNQSGQISINITISAPKWTSKTDILNEFAGLRAYAADALITRVLSFES